MKSMYLLIFILFISQSYTRRCAAEASASSINDCKGLELDEGYSYCCYIVEDFEYLGQDFKLHHCGELTKGQYNDIEDYIDDTLDLAEKNGIDYEELSVYCSSNHIMITLISLILFFL